MTLLLAWLTIFRHAILAGAALGLALSLAFVPSAMPSEKEARGSWAGPTAAGVLPEPPHAEGIAVVASKAEVGQSAGVPVQPRLTVTTSSVVDEAGVRGREPTSGTGLAATTTRSRGKSEQHVSDEAERATSTAIVPSSEAVTTSTAIPSSAPRAILIGRGSPLTVVRDANDVELAVIEAAREFGVDGALLLCVARAESTLRANVLGHAGERGPLQFMPRTWGYFERTTDGTARWTGNSARLGYSEQDVWLAIPAARVAASMFARGQAWQWTTSAGCAR